jgi:hypothetical protein
LSTQKTLEELLKEQLDLTAKMALVETLPDFDFAAAIVGLLDSVLDGDPQKAIKALRETILERYPDYAERLTVNGFTLAKIYEYFTFEEALETNENAVALLSGRHQ